MFGEVCRNKVYWLLDAIKGKPVKKHLDDIELKMHGNVEGNDKVLTDILKYAVQEVPYYRQLGMTPELDKFPVVNKKVIKDNYSKFQADKYADSQNVVILRTSGSTGQPFEVRQDYNKRQRCFAEMMYFWGLVGYQIGQKYAFYRTWNKKNKKGLVDRVARNLVMRDIVKLDDERLEEEKCFLQKNKDIKMLLGYASTLENLGNYLYSQGCKPEMFGVKSIIAISEALPEPSKKKLESVFGCPVISHYSNSENGVLAQWDEVEKVFIVNNASIKLELLSLETGEKVKEGEPGKVVITDMYNYSMPMIRYDTGDVAIGKLDKNGNWMLKSIEGRMLDYIYDTSGKVVSPHEISVIFWEFPKILQYQFVQTDEKEYILKYITKEDIDKNALKERIKGLMGDDAHVSVKLVDDISLASSGKRKYVLNEWKK